ncbi:MAG: hypothetical protein KBT75_05700 [Oleispira antarctica]|nr:hypothetical protein [Oleispira antarctica]MBQ0792203.1 hypothetical protein [Oleispira antarctica]
MSDNTGKPISSIPNVKHLMKLSYRELKEIFAPIFSGLEPEKSQPASDIMNELSDLVFGRTKIKLFWGWRRAFNAAQLYCYLLHIEISCLARAHQKTTNELERLIPKIEIGNKALHENYIGLATDYSSSLNKQQKESKALSNYGKQSNPTPPNTIKFFYACVDTILKLDSQEQLYLEDVNTLARDLLLDREAHYKIEWKKEKPFKKEWFKNKLRQYPQLPEYLLVSKGKNKSLRITTVKIIKENLAI